MNHYRCSRHNQRVPQGTQCLDCLDEKWRPKTAAERAEDPFDSIDLDALHRSGEQLHRMKAESDLMLRCALHEAGHAAMLWLAGQPVDTVTITPERGEGETERGIDGPAWSIDNAALVLAAGDAAERLRFPEATGVDDGDIERLVAILEGRLADGWDMPAAVEAVHDIADQIVTENAEAIQALASALITHRRLDGADAEAILAEHTEETHTPAPVGPRPVEHRSAVRQC